MKNLRKIFPFIPLLGIPLTLYYHSEDTGIENKYIFYITAYIQGIELFCAFYYLL